MEQTNGVAADRVCLTLAFLSFVVGAFELKGSYRGNLLFFSGVVFCCATGSWHTLRNPWLTLFCRVDVTVFLLIQVPKQLCEIGCPLVCWNLLDSGSSTVFKGIFRATCARCIDATPLSYHLTEHPSLSQIDSESPLGVQTLGLLHSSKAFQRCLC